MKVLNGSDSIAAASDIALGNQESSSRTEEQAASVEQLTATLNNSASHMVSAREFMSEMTALVKANAAMMSNVSSENDVLVLMLADSTVLYARPKPHSYIGKSLSGSHLFRQMLLNADRGSGEWAAALDGRRRIFGFASAERYPLVVAAGYDERTLFRHWLRSHLQDVALSSALLISVLVLCFFIVRQARLSQRY